MWPARIFHYNISATSKSYTSYELGGAFVDAGEAQSVCSFFEPLCTVAKQEYCLKYSSFRPTLS